VAPAAGEQLLALSRRQSYHPAVAAAAAMQWATADVAAAGTDSGCNSCRGCGFNAVHPRLSRLRHGQLQGSQLRLRSQHRVLSPGHATAEPPTRGSALPLRHCGTAVSTHCDWSYCTPSPQQEDEFSRNAAGTQQEDEFSKLPGAALESGTAAGLVR